MLNRGVGRRLEDEAKRRVEAKRGGWEQAGWCLEIGASEQL